MKKNEKCFRYLRILHGKIHDSLQERKKLYSLIKKIKAISEDTYILAFTPSHGNLGDHAIAAAEIKLLNDNGLEYVEINDVCLKLLARYHKLNVLDGSKILLNGGGYLGTLWPNCERLVRSIVLSCPQSSILILPNTICYEDDKILDIYDSATIFNMNPRLTVCTREKASYELAKKFYNNVKFIPDMVLSVNINQKEHARSGCLVCLRNDIERTMNDELHDEILSVVYNIFDHNVTLTDMVVNYSVTQDTRNKELKKKISQFLTAELIVTDRLHAMIFAAITGTPCVVFDSKSPKVKGIYELIMNNEYIMFARTSKDIEKLYKRVKYKDYTYDNSHLKKYYKELLDTIIDMKGNSLCQRSQ